MHTNVNVNYLTSSNYIWPNLSFYPILYIISLIKLEMDPMNSVGNRTANANPR